MLVVITSYHHDISDNQQLLTSEEIKEMLQKKIEEKEKELRPDLFNQRYVEEINTQLETFHSILADINDEERRRTLDKPP